MIIASPECWAYDKASIFVGYKRTGLRNEFTTELPSIYIYIYISGDFNL